VLIWKNETAALPTTVPTLADSKSTVALHAKYRYHMIFSVSYHFSAGFSFVTGKSQYCHVTKYVPINKQVIKFSSLCARRRCKACTKMHAKKIQKMHVQKYITKMHADKIGFMKICSDMRNLDIIFDIRYFDLQLL